MSKKMNLIPELRFPEFANNGKWDNKPISKLGETVNGLSGKKGADFGSGRPYVQYKQVFDKSFIDFTECGKVDVGENENQNQLQLGDILFTTSSETPDEVGFASVINKQPEEPTYLNSFCFILRPNDLNEINPGFSRYLFHSPIYRKSVSAIAQGSTRYNLSKKAFLKLRVPVPSTPEEQQKIAFCLSSLDEVISAHSQKLDLLKDHKKGLMQNLFPQEGENVPKYRFPEFEGDGEWELKPLEELCKLVRGPFGGALKKEIFVEEGYAVYEQSHAIYSDFRYFRYRINEEKYNELKRFSVRAGDLIMSCSGTMGKFSMIPDDSEPGVINQALLKLSVRNGNDIFFVKTSLETDTNQRKLLSQSAGGAIKNVVSVSQIRILELAVPKMREQQKIASCLSAVDELITAQQEKIDELQQHKKGLMQGLFPKIND